MSNQDRLDFDEQSAAEALDVVITQRLAGRAARQANDLPVAEASFASDLVELADAVQTLSATSAVPTTLAKPSSRLAQRSSRWSFLKQVIPARRPAVVKRTALALVGAAALAILIFLALPLVSPQQDLPPLPSLAMMRASAQGGTSGNSIFPGTTFVLNTTLPAAPDRVTVYRQPEVKPLTADEFRQLAERFGLRGTVYQEKLPANSPPGLTGYALFDGSRQMTMVSGDMAFYVDSRVANVSPSASTPGFQASADIAKKFLESRGLLSTPYRVEPVPSAPTNIVQFVRLLDGRPLLNSEIRVTVAPDGEVASASFRPIDLQAAGQYPIRSAQAAWEGLVSGKLFDRIQYSIHRDPPVTTLATQTRSWRPQYRPGQRADFYGAIMVYTPTQGGTTPLIKMNGMELRGKTQGLAEQLIGNLHVWGTLAADSASLDVTGWAKEESPSMRFQGTLQREGQLVLLRREDGKVYLLSNAPDDLPDGIAVSGYGHETNRTENGYPVLDWIVMQSPPDKGPSGPSGMVSSSVVVVQAQPITPTVSAGPTPTPPTRVPTGIQGIDEPYIPPGAYATPPLSANQRVEGLVGRLRATIYESADGKSRALFATLDDKPLGSARGWFAKLRGPDMGGIEKYDELHVRVWGKFVLEGDQPTIQVERYEKAYPDERIQAWLGKREPGTAEGKPVCFFQTREGERLVIAYSIAAGPDSCTNTGDWQTIMEGVLQPEMFSGHRVVEMLTSHSGRDTVGMTDLRVYQLEPRPRVVRPPSSAMSGKAYVDRVELVYYLAPITPGSIGKPIDPSRRIVQPCWKFSGHTDDGASFEILVQAVSDQYVR